MNPVPQRIDGVQSVFGILVQLRLGLLCRPLVQRTHVVGVSSRHNDLYLPCKQPTNKITNKELEEYSLHKTEETRNGRSRIDVQIPRQQ